MRAWLGLAGLALAFTFGCATAEPKKLCGPGDSEVVAEYLECSALLSFAKEFDGLITRVS